MIVKQMSYIGWLAAAVAISIYAKFYHFAMQLLHLRAEIA